MDFFQRQTIFLVLVLAVLVFLIVFVFKDSRGALYTEAETIGIDVATFEELSNRFNDLSEEKGALYAFEILRRAELPQNTDLHLLGHVVGDELYNQEGVSGIVHCTQEFRNACSHSLVIGTLNDFGEWGLDDIREACKQAPGGSGAYTMCYHGLGHGVFSHFAFQFPETVDFCEKTGTEEYNNREYIECVGGAVMELMGGGGHDPYNWEIARDQYLSTYEPLSLCMGDQIPDEAQEICLIYLTPFIWESVGIELGRPDPKKFPEAFAVCDSIPVEKQSLRDACFGGFGKEFVPIVGARDIRGVDALSDEQYARASSWCLYAKPEDGRRACIGDAVASLFWGGENDSDASFRFCSLTDVSMKSACYTRLAQDITSFVKEGGRKTDLCNRVRLEGGVLCE